jgi:hypothetical protein
MTEVLTLWLTPEQKLAGYYLHEEEHTIHLMKDGQVLLTWSATGATKEQILADIGRYFKDRP